MYSVYMPNPMDVQHFSIRFIQWNVVSLLRFMGEIVLSMLSSQFIPHEHTNLPIYLSICMIFICERDAFNNGWVRILLHQLKCSTANCSLSLFMQWGIEKGWKTKYLFKRCTWFEHFSICTWVFRSVHAMRCEVLDVFFLSFHIQQQVEWYWIFNSVL